MFTRSQEIKLFPRDFFMPDGTVATLVSSSMIIVKNEGMWVKIDDLFSYLVPIIDPGLVKPGIH